VITPEDETAFNRFNHFRNKVTHVFRPVISLEDAFKLALELESDRIDFSDSPSFHARVLFLEAGGRDLCSATSE
jgi:hypothetical protein